MKSEDAGQRTDVCGYHFDRVSVFGEDLDQYNEAGWYEEDGQYYCARPVWGGAETDRCGWHADIDGKPPEALNDPELDGPELLDGAVLREMDLPDNAPFVGFRLRDADFKNTRAPYADFSNADLKRADLTMGFFPRADLSEANLQWATLRGGFRNAKFTNANLREADLVDANLQEASLEQATLREADLKGANLEAADLTKAAIQGAGLSDARIWRADLTGANLPDAKLEDAHLIGATLVDAILERTNLTRATLFDADLTGARLYGAVLTDIRLNTGTRFGDHYTGPSDDLDKAAWTLRQLERLFGQNALPERARNTHIDRKDLRRRQYWDEIIAALRTDDPITDRLRSATDWARQWARTALYGATMRYGESPLRVVTLSVLTVFVFGVVYPFFGGMDASNEATTNYGFEPVVAGVDGLPAPVVDVLANLYFSAVTFTTLGYGDIQPATPVVELLATVESFLGALLMALLVFVLGRRATW